LCEKEPVLTLATDPQKIERDRLTHDPWGKGLTLEGYITREERLRLHPWAREGMQSLLLVDDRGAILCSCEALRMESFFQGDVDEAGAPRRRSSYGIASVFTEPALRGKGHATRMMSLVLDHLRSQDPGAHASVLFSDVGAPIYERAGYVARPAVDRVFEPEDGDPSEGVILLRDGDVGPALSLMPRPRAELLIWPSAAQIDWHLERERVYSALLNRARPEGCGARAGGSSILWASGFKSNELCVLLLHAESPEELHRLLRSARRAAGRAGLARVVHWEHPMPFAFPGGPNGGVLRDREGALPMICPLNPAITPDSLTYLPRALWV
jgi:GNAT superfamily N-acetyltransferase